MARAPALQAGGQGFDSLILHMPLVGRRFFDRMEGKTRKSSTVRKSDTHELQEKELGYSESCRRDCGGRARYATSTIGRTGDA